MVSIAHPAVFATVIGKHIITRESEAAKITYSFRRDLSINNPFFLFDHQKLTFVSGNLVPAIVLTMVPEI